MMVTGQWFHRPEEAQRRNGGNWQSRDTRELFYSFHRAEVPAESVMHKCVVHFIPLNKQIPGGKEHPGYIFQKVYDTEQMKLFKLTDKDYEDTKQQEIDLLVQKTIARVRHLPDIETEDNSAAPVSQEDQLKSKRLLRKKSMTPLDVTREDEAPTRFGQSKAETPGSCPNNASEYFIILSNFEVQTGETQRDKWLEKLLQSIQFLCNPVDNVQNDGKEKGGPDVTDLTGNASSAKHVNESPDNGANGDKFRWPDSAVPAVVALEKAAHESLSYDFQKYNQKMRQLTFNLKNNSYLSKTFLNSSLVARCLLNGELDPSQILNMSPNELKSNSRRDSKQGARGAGAHTDDRCFLQKTLHRCTEKKMRLM
ncbi:ASI1-immunoprecipitated protein 3-like isoform X3 [Nicotiana sylvestris]